MVDFDFQKLQAGEALEFSGSVLTVRDASLERMKKEGKPVIDLRGRFLFFCGPTPKPLDKITGALGPTTSQRMEQYLEMLLDWGVVGFLGKGEINQKYFSLFKNRAVLFSVVGGVSAFLSQKVVAVKNVAYEDLGAEAIWEFDLRNFPVLTVVDSQGKSFFTEK